MVCCNLVVDFAANYYTIVFLVISFNGRYLIKCTVRPQRGLLAPLSNLNDTTLSFVTINTNTIDFTLTFCKR